MPVHIIENENPEIPAWGSIALEVYFLSEWDKSHPDPSQSESHADRRQRLLRQFLALGYEGRLPYKPGNSPPSPTEAQIDEILRPIRPEALRTCAHNTGAEVGCWLRLCYTNDEGHEALWSANEIAEWVTYGGAVLDDESLFSGLDLAAALELFPERVTDERVNLGLREESLREAVDGAENYPSEENPLGRYAFYQADCVVTHIFVEDEVAVNGGGLLHVFLDDCRNVVRQWRVEDDGSEDNYDGAWHERLWKEAIRDDCGEIGPAYHEGGSRGPPYTL
ncbi:uncharacterized protein N7446_001008 [Penicillium canescens]|uniref:Uncharacterized protein n=1 Tax=Penicillium canescens TaxID=5083 RepID=A0AAD6I3B4_PENCN|nr:uncharacterized protein N7446_001008 [Penicillium canescens]KAJ6029929.1 hypothetical protein N7460_010195 [Penicillium canescens]KAJ6060309.1 hypothetical protein N7444_002163 [Penicillium canescens]KAJ6078072.1 hypothetical protein N7446_001008 [Penicillium canescens]